MEGLVLCRRITPPTDLRLVHEDLRLLYKGIGEADIEGTPRDAGTLLCTMERGSEGMEAVVLIPILSDDAGISMRECPSEEIVALILEHFSEETREVVVKDRLIAQG